MMNRLANAVLGSVVAAVVSMFVSGERWSIAFGFVAGSVALAYAASLYVGKRGKGTQQQRTPVIGGSRLGSILKQLDAIERDALQRLPTATAHPQRSAAAATVHSATNGTTQPTAQRSAITVTVLQAEAIEINKLLKDRFNVNARINWKNKAAIIETPLHTMYRLDERTPINAKQLEGYAGAIGRHVRTNVRKGKGRAIACTVTNTQPLYLQLSNQQPTAHPWNKRPAKLPPMTACIGDYWEGVTGQPALLSMATVNAPAINGIFCGMSGSGKSRLVQMAILTIAENTKPRDVQIYAVELKSGVYGCFDNLPHVATTAQSKADLMSILQLFESWCERGYTNGIAYNLLIIDEYQIAKQDPTIADEVERIVMRIMGVGRSMGLRVWIATSQPNADSISPDMKRACHFVVASYTRDDSYLIHPMKIRGASELVKNAECILDDEFRRNQIVATYWLPDDEFDAANAALHARYGVVPGGADGGAMGGAGVVQGGAALVQNSYCTSAEVVQCTSAGVVQSVSTRVDTHTQPKSAGFFPLESVRPLTDDEAIEAGNILAGGASKNALIAMVFPGTKNGKQVRLINEALQRIEGNE